MKNVVNNRRSEIEIISDICKLSCNGAKKTELLYQGNLSYTQLKEYLIFLTERNILEKLENKDNGNSATYYKTTEKGLEFLNEVNKVLAYLNL